MKKTIASCIYNLDYLISGSCFVGIVIITVFGVVARRLFEAPFAWLEEIQLLLFVWCVLTGANAAIRTGSHVGIDIVFDQLSPRVQKVVTGIIYIVVMLVLGYLFMAGAQLMYQAGDKLTPYLKIHYTYIDLAVPVGCGMMMITYTVTTYAKLFAKTAGRTENL